MKRYISNSVATCLFLIPVVFLAIVAQSLVRGTADHDVLVVFATSMDKILPRIGTAPPQGKSPPELKLARNEKESFQVIVQPRCEDIKRVWVRVSDLRSQDGTRGAPFLRG